jgi:hypothetical protein
MKPTLEYVISAVPQGMFPLNKKLPEHQQEAIRVALQETVDVLLADIKSKCKNYDPELSILYNAYTESQYTKSFAKMNNMHMSAVYADSGGLQMMTSNKAITVDSKKDIYRIQSYADYAMCFDEIPLSRKPNAKHSRNERSNTGNKLYHPDKLEAAGTATGLNIKEQIESFKSLGTHTKVIPIVQGNTWEDMVTFYKQIEKCLDPDDYNHISGLAVADTCMGNGELESIEMLRAAHNIAKFSHENIKNHLHVLGVGSIMRMRPIIYLERSKYLDTFRHISYDSSSHSSCFTYGLIKLNGTCTPLGTTRNRKAVVQFQHVYKLFSPALKKYKVSEAQFLDIVFGPKTHDHDHEGVLESWTHAAIKERAASGSLDYLGIDNDTLAVVAHLSKAYFTLYQIHNFMICLDDVWNDKFAGDPMTSLLRVVNDTDMTRWMKNMKSSIKSKRIDRAGTVNTLEDMIQ